MNKVWVSGDAVVDLIPNGSNSYLKCAGGAPANVAVGIARLGGSVGFFGRVGDDPFGQFMHSVLKTEHVDVTQLSLDPLHRTSTVLVSLDEHGERSFCFMVMPSADQFITNEDVPMFRQGQWLHLCSIALANEPSRTTCFSAMKNIKQIGGFVAFDPNLRESVWADVAEMRDVIYQALLLVDVIKLSLEEVLWLTETLNLPDALIIMEESFSPLLLIVTQGDQETVIRYQGKTHNVPTQSVRVVDTTGAGDAFMSGLLCVLARSDHWQDWHHIQRAVLLATQCGACAVTAKGAMTALPYASDLSVV